MDLLNGSILECPFSSVISIALAEVSMLLGILSFCFLTWYFIWHLAKSIWEKRLSKRSSPTKNQWRIIRFIGMIFAILTLFGICDAEAFSYHLWPKTTTVANFLAVWLVALIAFKRTETYHRIANRIAEITG